MILSCKGVDH